MRHPTELKRIRLDVGISYKDTYECPLKNDQEGQGMRGKPSIR